MVDIIINPGTGKVYGNLEQAEKNMKKFIEDTGIDFKSEYIGRTDNGRFLFKITNAKDTHEIEMVGEDIDSVRYVDTYKQDIYDFPRLYVDENSYVWLFAITNITDEYSEQCMKRLGINCDNVRKYDEILRKLYNCKECKQEKTMNFEEIKEFLRKDSKNLDSFLKTVFPCNHTCTQI